MKHKDVVVYALTELQNELQYRVETGEDSEADRKMLAAAEAALQDINKPDPALKKGDKVRHSQRPEYGTGIVGEIAKSGIRAYVDFGAINDWDGKKMRGMRPWSAYYEIAKLELVEKLGGDHDDQ